jgi:hypothetical protein
MDIDAAKFATGNIAPGEPLAPISPVGIYGTNTVDAAAPFVGYTQPSRLVPILTAAPAVVNRLTTDIAQISRLVGAAQNTAQPSLNAHYQIPLSVFKHTVLAMDKDIYWGQIIILRLTFATAEKIGLCSLVTANNAFTAIVAPVIGNL